jgi:hypothetical protein
MASAESKKKGGKGLPGETNGTKSTSGQGDLKRVISFMIAQTLSILFPGFHQRLDIPI